MLLKKSNHELALTFVFLSGAWVPAGTHAEPLYLCTSYLVCNIYAYVRIEIRSSKAANIEYRNNTAGLESNSMVQARTCMPTQQCQTRGYMPEDQTTIPRRHATSGNFKWYSGRKEGRKEGR